MSEPTYSVYFTGIWLNEAGAAARLELLRRLFPHADGERLEHFLDHRRVLLIHGEPLDTAKRVVMTLYEQGLECEIAEDADVAPDVGAVMASPSRPASPAAPPATAPAAMPRVPSPQADEFTPRGRKLLRALIIATAVLVLAASWSAWQSLQTGPTTAATEMTSTCATDTRTTWYGRTTAQMLHCVARTSTGERYELTLHCASSGAVSATLALFDAAGAGRSPVWRAEDGRSLRRIRSRSGDATVQTRILQRTDAAHVGSLPDIDAAAATRLLAAASLELADVFDGESVRFDFASARWYLDYFSGACGLAAAAR